MLIPIDSLSSDTLNAIINEFVLREGTEYGAEDISIEEKIAQVKAQLTNGTAVIVFSELHETVNILPASEFTE